MYLAGPFRKSGKHCSSVWVRTHTPMKKGPPTDIGLSWELLQAAGLVAECWADLIASDRASGLVSGRAIQRKQPW